MICIPFGVGVWWIPESPVFLLENGRVKEAENTLQFLDREIWDEDLPKLEKGDNTVNNLEVFS